MLLVACAALAAPAAAGHYCARPYAYSGWGWGWGSWWSPYAYSPGWWGGGYTTVYPNDSYGGYGALDFDVSPERAEIWVDGEPVGIADDLDGFPTLLWLEKGTYDVAIYLQGYVTLARQYTVYPGMIIDVEDRLERGESVHPTELAPKTHERRDARLQAEREIREDVERRRRAGELYDPDAPYEYEEPESDEPEYEEPGYEAPESESHATPPAGALDARAEPGRVVLRVHPDDASVYLDGRFLGTGRELAGLRSGLIVDPGEHRLEVVRPGHQAAERKIEVESGREIEIGIELDEE